MISGWSGAKLGMSVEGRKFIRRLLKSLGKNVHNNVPLDHGSEELELEGAECYDTVEDQPVIFDDESHNPAELPRHPERETILVSAAKKIERGGDTG